jgi:hypothetical protein
MDDSPRPQVGDLVTGVTELEKNCPSVLSNQATRSGGAWGRRESSHGPVPEMGPEEGMDHLGYEFVVAHRLARNGELGKGSSVDFDAGDVLGAQCRLPFRRRPTISAG